MAMRTHRVSLEGGASVEVEDAGQGPCLLMLHAGVADRHMWDGQWQWLQHGYRVVRWDWRGFGDTAHVPGSFSYADDVRRIMETLEISVATVIGCSFGGGVAIQVAIQYPARVERLALVGSGISGYDASNPPEVEAMFAEVDDAMARGDTRRVTDLMEKLWLVGPSRQVTDVDPAYLTHARDLLARADRPDNGAVSRGDKWSALGHLPHLTIPTLIVVGDQDVPDIISAAQYLAGVLPKARLEIIENAAHLPNLERPGPFDTLLGDWLKETAPAY